MSPPAANVNGKSRRFELPGNTPSTLLESPYALPMWLRICPNVKSANVLFCALFSKLTGTSNPVALEDTSLL
jgi:hypothetical protein